MTILFDKRQNRFASTFLTLCVFLSLLSGLAVAAGDEKKSTQVALTYYFDSRDYNTLNLTTGFSDLPLGFKVWGFVDISSDQNNTGRRFDFTRYFAEYRLKRSLFSNSNNALKGLGFEIEYNDFNDSGNTVVRPGFTYKHEVPFIEESRSWLEWRYHPYETDGSGSQVSVIYVFNLTEKIFISGFADLNLENNADDRWVVEPQINYKLNDTFDLVVETRYNEIEDANTALDGFGIAAGLKIKF
jgi:hypothetical protein